MTEANRPTDQRASPTPGPWCVEEPMEHELAIVEANKQTHEWKFIATVPCDGDQDAGEFPTPIAQANARLIAMAPDMRAVLDDLEEAFDRQTYCEKAGLDFDAPDDHEYAVVITAKQLRAISEVLNKVERQP